jgi:hypothetical protein
MRPVENTKRGYFQIGDMWNGEKIISLKPCEDRESCSTHYKNFEVACGGFHRIRPTTVISSDYFSLCPFYICREHLSYLSDSVDGGPLL